MQEEEDKDGRTHISEKSRKAPQTTSTVQAEARQEKKDEDGRTHVNDKSDQSDQSDQRASTVEAEGRSVASQLLLWS